MNSSISYSTWVPEASISDHLTKMSKVRLSVTALGMVRPDTVKISDSPWYLKLPENIFVILSVDVSVAGSDTAHGVSVEQMHV